MVSEKDVEEWFNSLEPGYQKDGDRVYSQLGPGEKAVVRQDYKNEKGITEETTTHEGQFDPNIDDFWETSDRKTREMILTKSGIPDKVLATSSWGNLPTHIQNQLEEIEVAGLHASAESEVKESVSVSVINTKIKQEVPGFLEGMAGLEVDDYINAGVTDSDSGKEAVRKLKNYASMIDDDGRDQGYYENKASEASVSWDVDGSTTQTNADQQFGSLIPIFNGTMKASFKDTRTGGFSFMADFRNSSDAKEWADNLKSMDDLGVHNIKVTEARLVEKSTESTATESTATESTATESTATESTATESTAYVSEWGSPDDINDYLPKATEVRATENNVTAMVNFLKRVTPLPTEYEDIEDVLNDSFPDDTQDIATAIRTFKDHLKALGVESGGMKVCRFCDSRMHSTESHYDNVEAQERYEGDDLEFLNNLAQMSHKKDFYDLNPEERKMIEKTARAYQY